jgi:cell division protein FtsB
MGTPPRLTANSSQQKCFSAGREELAPFLLEQAAQSKSEPCKANAYQPPRMVSRRGVLPMPNEQPNMLARRAALREEALAPPEAPRPPLLSRVIVWCTVIICLLLLLATFGQAWNVYGLDQQVAAQQQAVKQLERQNQQLRSAIQLLQEPGTIEQEARRLGYIYPGDQPVVVTIGGTPTPAPSPVQPAPPSATPWGFWSDWLRLFFGG